MTDLGAALDPVRVGRIVASFASASDRLRVAVVDASGTPVAASVESDLEAHLAADGVLVRDIHCAGGIVGRVVANGPAIGDPTVVSALEALAAGLGELAEADNRSLASELAQGRLAQRSFVSLRAPAVPGYDLASHYEAAREIGGDFFELFQLQRSEERRVGKEGRSRGAT